jgi:hypothetical protein
VGWLDYQQDHKFFCAPLHEEDIWVGEQFDYNIKILDITTGSSSQMAPDQRMISTSKDALLVKSDFFKQNRLYEITCNATHDTLPLTGGAKNRFNSYDLEEDFSFSIEALPQPDSEEQLNLPFKTMFKMSVLKPADEALHCEFGYDQAGVGRVIIEDLSTHSG